MNIKRFLSSRWFYYILIVLGLFVFIFVILPYWIHNQVVSPDLGDNLFAEAWGILFTVILLTVGIELGERLPWKPLKDRMRKKIGSQIRNIFLDLVKLVETSKDTTIPSKKQKPANRLKAKISRQLQEFKGKEEIELSNWGRKALTDQRLIDKYTSMLQKDKQALDEVETKYSSLLREPEIIKSIINVQKDLELLIWLIKDGYFWKDNERTREAYFENLTSTIHRIIREILKLDELGIEVSSLTD